MVLSKSKNIIIGQIGCGYWGPNLLRNFNSIKSCSLNYVAELWVGLSTGASDGSVEVWAGSDNCCSIHRGGSCNCVHSERIIGTAAEKLLIKT